MYSRMVILFLGVCGAIRRHRGVLGAILVVLSGSSARGSEVILVKADAAGPIHDGSTWGNAFTDLQDALDEGVIQAQEGPVEIWVAAGIYQPDRGTGDRIGSFELVNNIALYGGFAGWETCREQRDVEANETILSGDLGSNDGPEPHTDPWDDPTRADNAFHVVIGSGTGNTAVLDGFTITAGCACGHPEYLGGGMYNDAGSPTIVDCTFRQNSAHQGGAMYNDGGSPTVTGCTFTDNAADKGGAMYNLEGSPSVRGCTFTDNTADSLGGATFNFASALTVTSCTFGRNSALVGGAMYNDGGSPAVTGCTFTHNTADSGGAMYNDGGSPTVASCTFTDNTADSRGGAMYNSAFALTVTYSTFSRNSAYTGGGMYNGWSDPTLADCTFSANSAQLGGGMFNIWSNPTLVDCTFRANFANGHAGGGMFNSGSDAMLTNCTFSGNMSSWDGGGMWNDESSPILTNCTFSGNVAERSGGGISSGYNCSPTLTNCILWGNYDVRGADESAQIASMIVFPPVVTYTCIQGLRSFVGNGNIPDNPLFIDADGPDDITGTEDDNLHLLPRSPCIDGGDNEAVPQDNADIDEDLDTIELYPFDLDRNPRFVDDPCTDDAGNPHPDFPGVPIVDMGAYEYQGSSEDDPDGDGVTGCHDNCPVHWNPGQADCNQDGLGDVCALTLEVSEDCNHNDKPDECDITENTSFDDDANGIPDECQRIIFVDDDASLGGDGVSWDTAYKYLQDALGVALYSDNIHMAGGTYKPDQDEARNVTAGNRSTTFQLVSGVGVYGGFAGLSGGANADRRDTRTGETILSGDLLNNDDPEPSTDPWNDATRDDNSYHVTTGSGTNDMTVLDGLTITAGNANGENQYVYVSGGGMYTFLGSPRLNNCTFRGNTAEHSGGGMLAARSNTTLSNCTFADNAAGVHGGGMLASESSVTVSDCTFGANSAENDGGGMFSGLGNMMLMRCTFSSNSAGWRGAGMAAWETDVTLIDGTFRGNSAIQSGGGMFSGRSNMMLTRCTFSGNMAESGGGMHSSGGTQTVANCTFSGNKADGDGGGIYCSRRSSATLTTCTFSGNSARNGKGIACDSSNQDYPSTLESNNCVFWDGGDEIWNNDGSAITAIYTCIQDEDSDDGVVFPGQGNIDDDPLFIDALGSDGVVGTEDDDLRLASDSPALSTGDPAYTPDPEQIDLAGNPRLQGCRVDMGAFEAPMEQLPGDFDGNGSVDLRDIAGLQLCVGVSIVRPDWLDTCVCLFDADESGDIDLTDFAAFHTLLFGD